MIVCHCNVIASDEIEKVVLRLSTSDPHCIITPGTVFQCCGKRPNCGACMPLVVASLAAARMRCAEIPRARTLLSDPAGVAAVELAGANPAAARAGEQANAADGRCRDEPASANVISMARGARR